MKKKKEVKEDKEVSCDLKNIRCVCAVCNDLSLTGVNNVFKKREGEMQICTTNHTYLKCVRFFSRKVFKFKLKGRSLLCCVFFFLNEINLLNQVFFKILHIIYIKCSLTHIL